MYLNLNRKMVKLIIGIRFTTCVYSIVVIIKEGVSKRNLKRNSITMCDCGIPTFETVEKASFATLLK